MRGGINIVLSRGRLEQERCVDNPKKSSRGPLPQAFIVLAGVMICYDIQTTFRTPFMWRARSHYTLTKVRLLGPSGRRARYLRSRRKPHSPLPRLRPTQCKKKGVGGRVKEKKKILKYKTHCTSASTQSGICPFMSQAISMCK